MFSMWSLTIQESDMSPVLFSITNVVNTRHLVA